MYEVCEKSTRKVLIKQYLCIIEQTLFLSCSQHTHRRYARTFRYTQNSGGTRRRTSRRRHFCWPLHRSSWGSPGQMRGQPAVPSPLGRGRRRIFTELGTRFNFSNASRVIPFYWRLPRCFFNFFSLVIPISCHAVTVNADHDTALSSSVY